MTIQEAIKSGKKFRCSGLVGAWLEIHDGLFTLEEVYSTDWEVLLCETHNFTSSKFTKAPCQECFDSAINFVAQRDAAYGITEENRQKAMELFKEHGFNTSYLDSDSVILEAKKCSCDLLLILQQGCKCGGQ